MTYFVAGFSSLRAAIEYAFDSTYFNKIIAPKKQISMALSAGEERSKALLVSTIYSLLLKQMTEAMRVSSP